MNARMSDFFFKTLRVQFFQVSRSFDGITTTTFEITFTTILDAAETQILYIILSSPLVDSAIISYPDYIHPLTPSPNGVKQTVPTPRINQTSIENLAGLNRIHQTPKS